MLPGMDHDRAADAVHPPKLEAVDHVRVAYPTGRAADIARFYGELLGLAHLQTEAHDNGPTLSFGSARLRLEFHAVERPTPNPNRRRLTLRVASLEDCRARLEDAEIRCQSVSGLALTDRTLLVLDPAQNLLELRQDWSQ